MYSVMWSEHCSYKSCKVLLPAVQAENTTDEMREKLLVGIGENAGVVDIGDGWAVTFKVESPQPPVVRRALPGRGDRRRRHRPRHHVDGRAADRGDGPAALRQPRPPRHRARPARRRRRRRRLRQLPRPAQHRRRGRLRRLLPGQPARQRPVGRRMRGRGHPPRQGLRASATRSSSSAPRPAATASAASPSSRPRPSTPTGPAKRPAVQVGDPFAEKVLIECCLDLYTAHVVDGIQDLGGAGLSCATSELASNGDGGMQVELDRVPLRDAIAAARGDPHVGVAGADDGRRRAGAARGVHGHHRPLGRRGRRRRRGHRRRAPGDHLARRGHRRRRRRARSPTTARSTTARRRGRHTSTRCRRTGPQVAGPAGER